MKKIKYFTILLFGWHIFSVHAQEKQSYYPEVFIEVNNMLLEKSTLDFKKAVILTENAYWDNQLNKETFNQAIRLYTAISKDIVASGNDYTEKDKDIAMSQCATFVFMTDTVSISIENGVIGNLPFSYNHSDFAGQQNYDSHFVTTLMQTGTGQCHSMPLYYLVLAEEMGAEAYWSFSPHHSFVKMQDKKGNWHNLELTAKAILSDTHYMNSSYIKSEALQNKIYLEPMDKTNTIAEMLLELARGYYQKCGYDDFYLKCIDTAQKYLKNDMNAKLLRSAYKTQLTLTLAHLLNAPKPEIMQELSPEAYKHFELMQAQYKEIDDQGYEETPVAVYALSQVSEQLVKFPILQSQSPCL